MTKMVFKLINWSIKKRTGYSLSKLDVAAAAKQCTVPVLLGCANADTLISPLHRCASCPFLILDSHSQGGLGESSRGGSESTRKGKPPPANQAHHQVRSSRRRQSSRATQLPQRHLIGSYLARLSRLGSVLAAGWSGAAQRPVVHGVRRRAEAAGKLRGRPQLAAPRAHVSGPRPAHRHLQDAQVRGLGGGRNGVVRLGRSLRVRMMRMKSHGPCASLSLSLSSGPQGRRGAWYVSSGCNTR